MLSYSQDGRLIVGQGVNRKILVWDVQQGSLLFEIDACSNMRAMGFSSDAKVIASYCPYNKRLMFFSLNDGSLLSEVDVQSMEYGDYALAGNLSRLVVEQDGGNWQVFNLRIDDQSGVSLEEAFSIDPQAKYSSAIGISRDGKYLANIADEVLHIWDLQTAEIMQSLELSDIPSIYRISAETFYFSPDDSAVFVLTDFGLVLWDFSQVGAYQTLPEYQGRIDVNNIDFSPDGQQVFLTGEDGVTWYSTTDGSRQGSAEGSMIEMAVVLADGSLAALHTYTSSLDDMSHLKLSKLVGNELKFLWETAIEPDSASQTALALSTDGRYAASANNTGILRLFDASDGTILSDTAAHDSDVWTLVFSPDVQYLASASYETAHLWRIQDDQLVAVNSSSLGKDCEFAFSPDSQVLAAACDQGIHFISTQDGSPIFMIPEIKHAGIQDFSPDGSLLASGDGKGVIRVWEVSTGKTLVTLRGHADMLIDLDFSADGKMLASLSRDGTLRVWGVLP